ncbi:oligopeptide transporter protein [Teratosphaeria nubilosa]|uniref:Oligopeptide transporter protein n=1 Tax=Teratosphaeria nubilosa TaxID=161662 RepID=A0A6G1L1D0_9PEZI|nr:oligopeptide transporter protein [Teratosphaeria nubilosa]
MEPMGSYNDDKLHATVDEESSSERDAEKSSRDPKRSQGVVEVVERDVLSLAGKLGDKSTGLAPVADLERVMDKVATLTVKECREIIKDLLEDHEHDYNFATAQREKLKTLLNGPEEGQSQDEWELQLKSETAINKFYSPYPEVRAVTTPDDDADIPCETIRAHLLGYLWACIAQFCNSMFNSRYPSISITSSVIQIFLYPCGMLMAYLLPDWGFRAFGTRVSLNPGKWTYKEQMLSTLIVNISISSAYVFWNIQTQEVYYHETWLTPGYKILLLLSTQCMGLGFAGLIRRFVIYPQEAIWPGVLPTVALNRALLVPESKEKIHGWSISKYNLFWLVFSAMFVYFWLPNYLMPALSYFAWMAWIKPDNFNLAVVTGSQFGLGFNPISSFDWNIFGTYWAPLAYPFFAYFTQYIGLVIGGFAILGIYYTNTKWTAYLPINSSAIFDNTGERYNISKVVENGILNESKYKAYSPAFYAAGNLVAYSAYFMYYPLTMTFVMLDSWRPISKAWRQSTTAAWLQIKRIGRSSAAATAALSRGNVKECGNHLYNMMNDETSVYDGFDDPLINSVKKYPEVPDWWYLAVASISFMFAIILCAVWEEQKTPVWTILFVVALNLVFLIPMTYLLAISGSSQGLNVLTELVVGYALPGHPDAMMFVKAYGYMIDGQADSLMGDQKMGLYAKLPPRAMYRGQLISVILTCFVAYGAIQFVNNDIEGICTPDQPAKFNCAAGSQIFFSASVVWGAIGPKRIFGQIYPEMKYAFLLGFLLALAWWAVKKFGPYTRTWAQHKMPTGAFTIINTVLFTPISWLKYVHPVLLINGMIMWAPQNLTYFTGGLYLSFIFMYYLRRYKTAWFEKYNYVFSAALTGGVAFSGLIMFFAVQFHDKPIHWWGTDVIEKGVDGGDGRSALLTELPASGSFGPATWF